MHTCRKNSLYAETPRGDDTTLAHLFAAVFLKTVSVGGSPHPLGVGWGCEWISRMQFGPFLKMKERMGWRDGSAVAVPEETGIRFTTSTR